MDKQEMIDRVISIIIILILSVVIFYHLAILAHIVSGFNIGWFGIAIPLIIMGAIVSYIVRKYGIKGADEKTSKELEQNLNNMIGLALNRSKRL